MFPLEVPELFTLKDNKWTRIVKIYQHKVQNALALNQSDII